MDEMWPLLRRLTNLSLPALDTHEAPKRFGYRPKVAAHLRLLENQMEELTRRIAPCDWRLYELATNSTRRILHEWSAAADAAVQAA